MKIAYVTTYDVLNASSWSKNHGGNYGASYQIAQSLRLQNVDIDYIGPLEKRYAWLSKSKWSFYHHLFQKDYFRWSEPLVYRDYSRQIAQKLSGSKADLVLCPEGAFPIAHLNCEQPVVLWVDTLLASLIDFFPYLSNLCQETRRNIYAVEKTAISRCDLLIVTSEWAAKEAVQLYGFDPQRIHVIPRGANLDAASQYNFDDIKNLIQARRSQPCKLLFLGVDWYRKGGDIALAVMRQLQQVGFKAELTVVGCHPKLTSPVPDGVQMLGYINKSTAEGAACLHRLLSEAHFLILPTRSDVCPLVLSEANSFGIPCLTTDIAGIPSVIKNDVNGKTFAPTAEVSEYCSYIVDCITDNQRYENLALGAFHEYQSRLNWTVSSQKAKALFQQLI